jgi:hypothetical protein
MLEDASGNIDYDEEDAGPTILFVPGSCGTPSAWLGVIAALDAGFRTVTTSLLGYGGTKERRTAAEPSIWSEAAVLDAVARHAGGRVHLVGPRSISSGRRLCRQDCQGCETSRPADRTTNQVRTGFESCVSNRQALVNENADLVAEDYRYVIPSSAVARQLSKACRASVRVAIRSALQGILPLVIRRR